MLIKNPFSAVTPEEESQSPTFLQAFSSAFVTAVLIGLSLLVLLLVLEPLGSPSTLNLPLYILRVVLGLVGEALIMTAWYFCLERILRERNP